MAAPVTIWTAWDGDRPVGLTVSSLMTVEGDPPAITGAIGPLSDFRDALERSGRFIVHILGSHQVRLADQFAGRYPMDPFEGVAVGRTEGGPALADAPTRASCRLRDAREVGHFLVVTAEITAFSFGAEDTEPLVSYRGGYYTLRSRR